ncbi:hypothetical protein FRC10_005098 [Ceratobasidium sp. 414]|nr:hypothetical protein FRC10_005098 [Ceratobasidium sp. 414]
MAAPPAPYAPPPAPATHELSVCVDPEKAPAPPPVPTTLHIVEEPAPAAGSSKVAETGDDVPSSSRARPRQHAVVQRPVDRFTVLPNLQDPKSYRRRDKAGITFVVALASFAGPYGRRPIYLAGFLIFTLASVLCAVATNVGFLLCARFIQAAGASCAQSVGLGIIADIYVPEERGRATGWWFLGPIAGPLVSPLISGALITWTSSWRSTMWFNVIFGGVLEILIVLFLPETSNALKSRQAAALANPPQPSQKAKLTPVQVFNDLFQLFIVRPFRTVLYIRFMPVGLTVYYGATCFACLYSISIAIPFSFGGEVVSSL